MRLPWFIILLQKPITYCKYLFLMGNDCTSYNSVILLSSFVIGFKILHIIMFISSTWTNRQVNAVICQNSTNWLCISIVNACLSEYNRNKNCNYGDISYNLFIYWFKLFFDLFNLIFKYMVNNVDNIVILTVALFLQKYPYIYV